MMNTGAVPLFDKRVAAEYIFDCGSIINACEKNSIIAKQHFRFDHEQMFKALRCLFPKPPHNSNDPKHLFTWNPLTHRVVTHLWVSRSIT